MFVDSMRRLLWINAQRILAAFTSILKQPMQTTVLQAPQDPEEWLEFAQRVLGPIGNTDPVHAVSLPSEDEEYMYISAITGRGEEAQSLAEFLVHAPELIRFLTAEHMRLSAAVRILHMRLRETTDDSEIVKMYYDILTQTNFPFDGSEYTAYVVSAKGMPPGDAAEGIEVHPSDQNQPLPPWFTRCFITEDAEVTHEDLKKGWNLVQHAQSVFEYLKQQAVAQAEHVDPDKLN